MTVIYTVCILGYTSSLFPAVDRWAPIAVVAGIALIVAGFAVRTVVGWARLEWECWLARPTGPNRAVAALPASVGRPIVVEHRTGEAP